MEEEVSVKNISRLRNEIGQIVSSIIPLDSLENEHQNKVIHWLETADEIFRIAKPATPDPHLVSYFAVISPNEKKILLVDHINSGLWLPPGGHVEPNEHPTDTVRREIQEELAVQADFLIENPLFVTMAKTAPGIEGHTDISLWYVLNGSTASPFLFDKREFKGIRWFGIEEIPYDQSDPHIKRFIDKLEKYSLL